MIFLGRLGLVLFVALVSLRCLANGHGEEPSVTPPVKSEIAKPEQTTKPELRTETKPESKLITKNESKVDKLESKSESEASKVLKEAQAKRLYELFNKSFNRTQIAVFCLKDQDCYKPEDEVLKFSEINIKLLQKLEDLVAKNDIYAMYYRGLIAYERGLDYKDRASYIRDRDFISTANILNVYGNIQFRDARKYFQVPANAKHTEACKYLGEIYAKGYGVTRNPETAMGHFYCAALQYLKEGKNLNAELILKNMTETGIPNDARTVDIYAKIHGKAK
jgi:hypothetical protein